MIQISLNSEKKPQIYTIFTKKNKIVANLQHLNI